MDLSILIVHYNPPRLLRQTLRSIRRAAPRLFYEIFVVDNNPSERLPASLHAEFPEVHILKSEKNIGFASGMNQGMKAAHGRHFLIFNPDMIVLPGSLEHLTAFLDEHPSVGMVGPKLLHPDGTLQFSCYRFMKPITIVYRRLPLIDCLSCVSRELKRYLMSDWDHTSVASVDYLLGACLLVRREAVEEVGGFDPSYFMYFEDQDWCRRFWQAGWEVVYHPEISMIHYHRRETAEGGFFRQLFRPLTHIQLRSAWRYFRKFRGQPYSYERKKIRSESGE
ncbi:MAG: Glycosyl transferase family 2 [Candidatus Uhrbacteria bacterium GW2011_GWA2_41_10]|nr:MAG: Glycosyl transferase family 2 [Candidatus Uhrbacteria bacterium GW2011_GWA2_41_10]